MLWGFLAIALGLVTAAIGVAEWMGVWRNWAAFPIVAPSIAIIPGGAGFAMVGLAVVLDLSWLVIPGVILVSASLVAMFFSPLSLEPRWYRELPEEVKNPRRIRRFMWLRGWASKDRSSTDYGPKLFESRAQFVDEIGEPARILGSITTAFSGQLSLYPDRLVFLQRWMDPRDTDAPLEFSIPLSEITRIREVPLDIRASMRAMDIGGMTARRKRLQILTPSRAYVFVVPRPQHWLDEIGRRRSSPIG